LVQYEAGQRVDIVGDPMFVKTLPHRRFHGKTGIVVGERGRCYEVKVRDGEKWKTIFIGREHLRRNKSDLLNEQAANASA
jgi:large subunit ribosomal protein L21e